ncbi:protein zinc induced facilitator-LIKE 1 [Favolaschia claudopus]|uniref:Protein zinc induced facilitator-LIKE 1 n=1 Tax=Favolaschia claudopus TaxID=2862362 RepID=A0AAW0DQ03_9AGAR
MAVDEDQNRTHTPNDEATALLPKTQPTPLPKAQLSILFLVQLSEPVTATVIYPFIAQIVRDTGITHGDETATGYFAGLIESAFFAAECATVFLWSMASDRFGRRPILLFGPFGLALAMIGFGLSRTFWPLVFFRFMQGCFNGNMGVSKSVMAELSDASNMAEIFGLIPLIWSLGATLGPTVGGIFANPAERWPNSLGRITLLQNYPYLLPCLVAGGVAFLSFLVALTGLKEVSNSSYLLFQTLITPRQTHPSFRADRDSHSSTPSPPREAIQRPPIRSLMTRQVLLPISSFALLVFTETSYSVLTPLVYSASIAHGGLGFPPIQIGLLMGVWGLYNILWQATAVSRLIKIFGPRAVHVFGYSCHLVGFGFFIVMNVVARAYGEVNSVVWVLIVVQFLFCNSMIYMSFATGHMFIADSAPDKAALSMTNALGQAAGSVSRIVGPIFANSLFSLSTKYNLLNGYLVFVILLVITLGGIRCSLMLPRQLRRRED